MNNENDKKTTQNKQKTNKQKKETLKKRKELVLIPTAIFWQTL